MRPAATVLVRLKMRLDQFAEGPAAVEMLPDRAFADLGQPPNKVFAQIGENGGFGRGGQARGEERGGAARDRRPKLDERVR